MQHEKTLADAVQKTLSGEFTPVRPPVKTFFTTTELEFAPVDPDQFKEDILGNNRYMRNRASFILEAADKGYDEVVNIVTLPRRHGDHGDCTEKF